MDIERPSDALEQFEQVVEERFSLRERQAAMDLLRDAFHLLPWELQDLYLGVVELYRERKWAQASALFEEWLDQARELGLV